MNFATRDRYRHAVEEIARGTTLSEVEVARRAIRLTHENTAGDDGIDGDDRRPAHVGYYLIDQGRALLGRAAGMRVPPAEWPGRLGRRMTLTLYLGGIAAITGVLTASLLALADGAALTPALLAALGVALLSAASQLAPAGQQVAWASPSYETL